MKKNLKPYIFWSLLFIAGLIVFWEALKVPFIYSEVSGIEKNQTLKDSSLFFERMISLRGLFDKPVVLFTFMLNHQFSSDPFGFHVVNLLIHFANSLLLWRIARLMNCDPWVSSVFFFFHPLSTSVVSQVFGRPYSLGLFVFLICFLNFKLLRQELSRFQALVLVPIYFCVLMIKQSFILSPLIFIKDFGRKKSRFVLGLTLITGLLFLTLYAIPYSITAPVPWLHYGISQVSSIPRIVALFFIPFRASLIHDWPFYSTPFHVNFLLGLGVSAIVLAISVCKKQSRPFIFLFLILYLPTQNFLAKNEIVREWRLYPSLAVLSLSIGYLMHKYKSKLLYEVFSILILIYAYNIREQSLIYQDGIKTWTQVVEKYPFSATGWNNLGFEWVKRKEILQARDCFLKATQSGPKTPVYYKNLASVFSTIGDIKRSDELRLYAQKLESLYGKNEPAVYYSK